MANKYNFSESEAKWQAYWEENQTFAFNMNETDPNKIFSIDTPPPTVSWKLHIWHVFSYTQAEIIARYKRMKWFNVFYPMWYDDNWIPTEQLVERELWVNIKEIERKDFVAKCLEINQKYRDLYKSLWQSLGISVDWNRTYATISPEVQQLVQTRFVEMYEKWQIVCKEFPSLRCTKNQTTIAQAETEEKEFNEFFNYLNFTLDDWEKLVIATTRPEMLPACLAVFVHPDDERFQKYIWKTITTPLWVKVPLLADDKVKMDKWTWVVMCCSYWDEVDVYWVKKHNLWEKIIINRYWRIENSGCEVIEWMKVDEAREKIMEYLQSQPGIVVKRDPIIQAKQISERWKVPVEIIPVYQWFVNILDMRDTLLSQNDKMNWYPDFMKKRSNDWINNLQWDWNISRSRKFWIPLPVWYKKWTKEIILASKEQLARWFVDPSVDLPDWYTADEVDGETLVLDTWFTSSQSPYINETFLKKSWWTGWDLCPFSLRPQAHDIIRTWLLYTTLQSYFRTWDIPFKNVMISGHVLAWKSEKISKSSWNAKVDPETLIKQRWADAVRYWTSSWVLWKDMVFDEEELRKWQKLVTKLWNAFQFVRMQLQNADLDKILEPVELESTDQWILSRLNETIIKMNKNLDAFEFWLAKIAFEEFFWWDFCDNYLELIKVRLYQPERFEDWERKQKSGQQTLYRVFYSILLLISPYVPHITEEIFQDYFKEHVAKQPDHQWINVTSIHREAYPESIEWNKVINEEHLAKAMETTLNVVNQVRRFKTESQISMWTALERIVIYCSDEDKKDIELFEDDVLWVTKADTIEWKAWDLTVDCVVKPEEKAE